jgi:hypothetical protein
MNEWFVPKFGPPKFRIACGMLFLPYTGMCLSFVIWGCLISSQVDFEKLLSIIVIYFLSLGVAAHVADSVGSKPLKPWGQILSKKQSWTVIILSLGTSYLLGLYYSLYYSPYLIVIGIAEGFFLFAYNFELFRGRFHNNFWFSISWGLLPFFAGFVIQTNSLNLIAIMLSVIPFGLSYLEIKVSRVYKLNKRSRIMPELTAKYELVLKLLSLGTISLTILLLIIIGLKISV